jgi:DNA-binding transcriptional regulator YiaG
MVPFYNEYRRRHKMLTPTEIVAIRKRYALSHEAFAKILGMSPATLYRYEGGALQDDVHDNLIRLCRSHQSMNIIMTHRKDRVSPLQFRRFRQALANQGQDRAIPSKAKRHLPKFRVRRSSPSMR